MGNMANQTAMKFARLATAEEVVLNALQAAFILELDEMAFACMLTTRQKASYYDLSRRRKRSHAESEAPCLLWIRLMSAVATTVILKQTTQGDFAEKYERVYTHEPWLW